MQHFATFLHAFPLPSYNVFICNVLRSIYVLEFLAYLSINSVNRPALRSRFGEVGCKSVSNNFGCGLPCRAKNTEIYEISKKNENFYKKPLQKSSFGL